MGDPTLKPCPFCGGEAVYDKHVKGAGHSAGCKSGCASISGWMTREDAAETWNTRPIEDNLSARVKLLKVALGGLTSGADKAEAVSDEP